MSLPPATGSADDPQTHLPDDAAAYWEDLWATGSRYRTLCPAETALMDTHLGPGRGRAALDIGCGSGELAWHLQHAGYRATGIDLSPTALAAARQRPCRDPAGREPTWMQLDISTTPADAFPDPAYALITCRLVYKFIPDKPGFLGQVRDLLTPGGVFWVVTELADCCPPELAELGITAADVAQLTAGWSHVSALGLDRLACYALRR